MITPLGWGFVAVWAIRGDAGVVLVDAHYPGHAAKLERRLARAGIDADDVTALVLTHAHGDHAGSAGALGASLGVPVVVGAADAPLCIAGDHGDSARPTGSRGALFGFAERPRFPAFTPSVQVDGALDLAPWGVAATARVVGGHTPGSLVVEVGEAVLVGDLVRTGLLSHHRPRLHFFHADPSAAHAALAEVLAPRGVAAIYPGHGDRMDAARVRAWLDRRRGALDARWARRDARDAARGR